MLNSAAFWMSARTPDRCDCAPATAGRRSRSASRRFATANGMSDDCLAAGTSHVSLCYALCRPEQAHAETIADGLSAMLRGERADFCHEYRCDSTEKSRWFSVRITRFSGEGPR